MKFNYKRYGPDILRPVIEIKVSANSESFKYHVLVDSGADICLFHSEVGEAIGLDIKKGKPNIVTGVGGKSSEYFLHKITIEVGGWPYEIEVGFLPNIGGRSAPYGIVGQQGFFEFFKVIFDRKDEAIELRRKE